MASHGPGRAYHVARLKTRSTIHDPQKIVTPPLLAHPSAGFSLRSSIAGWPCYHHTPTLEHGDNDEVGHFCDTSSTSDDPAVDRWCNLKTLFILEMLASAVVPSSAVAGAKGRRQTER